MKKSKIILALVIMLGFSAIASISASAFSTSMPDGTVIIGPKAYDLEYANDPKNSDEITKAVVAGGSIYIKGFDDVWIENSTGKKVATGAMPGVTYKNVTGVETKYKAGDILDDTAVATTPVEVISIN